MIRALLCKLPRWMGGGHREKRVTRSNEDRAFNRQCVRCGATRMAKTRKRATV